MKVQEKFDDAKWIIRSRKSKEAKEKRHDLQNATHKQQKQLRKTNQAKKVLLATPFMLLLLKIRWRHEWGTDEIVITTYPWSLWYIP